MYYITMTSAGLAAAKGHVPYALFMLLDVLRTFPGQVTTRMEVESCCVC